MTSSKITLSLFIYSLLQPLTAHAQNVIGPVPNPTRFASPNGEGLFLFLGNILKLVGTVAGIYMIIQIILGGIGYISASGDPKKAQMAWAKIYQSLMGMIIISSAFVLAAVVERITGIRILSPIIYGPN
jgi:hypothetical protein